MRLIISARGMVLTAAGRRLVERKLGKLDRVLPQALEARVTCQAEKFRRTVRIRLQARRHIFSSAATAAAFAVAVDNAVEALRRQICESKDRRRSRRSPGDAELIEPVA